MYKCSYFPALQLCSFYLSTAFKKRESKCLFYAMVSLPGNLRSLKVCMLMTSSVLTMTGGWGLCLSRRWHLRDTRSSSIMALQKDLCEGWETKGSWSEFAHSKLKIYSYLMQRWSNMRSDGHIKGLYMCRGVVVECWGKKKKGYGKSTQSASQPKTRIFLCKISLCIFLPYCCCTMTWCILHFIWLKSHEAAWPIKLLPLSSLLLMFALPETLWHL